MKIQKYTFWAVFFLIFNGLTYAGSKNNGSVITKNDTQNKEVRFYTSLLHRHQNFFGEAFSFQGIEAGAIVNPNFFLGIYGAAFASNLKVEIDQTPMFVNIWQTGLTIGQIYKKENFLHPGWLINTGYFSLVSDDSEIKLFNPVNPAIKEYGIVVSPEIYAEINVSRWMKFRTGLAYSFYAYQSQSAISKSDLQNVSINFGFSFGRFN
jgi:hypothetical protein